MNDLYHLPEFLDLSDERKQENARQQAELRAKFNSRMKLTPAERERAAAFIIEPSQREMLERQPTNENLRAQYCDTLAALGLYKTAWINAIGERREFYRKINEAIWRDDEDECDCPADVQILGQDRIQLPKFRILKCIYSVKHSAFMNLLEQNCCGEWNVRELTNDLTKLHRAAAHNQTAENKKTDADLLKI